MRGYARRRSAIVAALLASTALAHAQSQAPLAPGMTQFVDGNGAPYAGGKIYSYFPTTSTPKQTFKDPNGAVPNANPLTLDANGRAVLWGNGLYRQVLVDALGNTIWDQQTSGNGGGASGSASAGATCASLSSSGSVNAQILSPNPAVTALVVGAIYCGFAGFTNTGGMQLQVSATGYQPVRKQSPTGLAALAGAEVVAGFGYLFEWDGTEFQILNPSQFALTNGTTATTQPFTDASAKVATNAFVAGYYGSVNNAVAKGVVCDGTTDTTTALQTWALATTDNALNVLPPGKCMFSGTIHFPPTTHVKLAAGGTELVYTGSDPTVPLLTFGTAHAAPGYCSVRGWIVEGLRLESNTLMGNQNWGAIVNDSCESRFDLDVGGQLESGSHNIFNGIWINGGNQVRVLMNTYVQGVGLQINGDSASIQATDVYIDGVAAGGLVGVLIAGASGGITFGAIDILGNSNNVVINQSVVASHNNQIFFGPGTAIDVTSGGSGYGLEVDDTGDVGTSEIIVTGTSFASSSNSCIHFEAGGVWRFVMVGGTIFNCQASGIYFGSAGIKATITGTMIGYNQGYGIDNGGGSGAIAKCSIFWDTNTLGNTNGAVGSSC